MSNLRNLIKNKIIKPPKFVSEGLQYETIMGSVSYGVSNDNSDVDIYGFCIPDKELIFPHLSGEIQGFGKQTQRFEQFQQHHVKHNEKEYDFSIYSIVKYFQLCMENNPNMIDSLFTPRRCVTYISKIGEHIRENRRIFLHKGSFFKFKGYAYSQLHKMKIKNPDLGSKRYESILKYGMDLKFAYHILRLLDEVKQILIEGDLDLERNREQLKSVRRGEWTIEQIEEYFTKNESELETVYLNSKLQHSPDENKIKQLLIDCLEEYFGSLGGCVSVQNQTELILSDLQNLVNKYKK